MCEIIQFPTQARIHAPASTPFVGAIDVYQGENGKVGIDACVPKAFATDITDHILPGVISLYDDGNGRVGFDTQISAYAAEKVLAAAARAAIPVLH